MANRRTQEEWRYLFFFWWPVAARTVGVLAAFVQAGYAVVTKQSADPAFLAFCGALIVAPIVFDTQEKRNLNREVERKDETVNALGAGEEK